MDWRPPLAALVQQLTQGGHLRSSSWCEAFEQTPRHVFVPSIITIDEAGPMTTSGAHPAQRQSWLEQVYSDDSPVTQYLAHPSLMMAGAKPLLVSTSSSTMPSLMACMLEVADPLAVDRTTCTGREDPR